VNPPTEREFSEFEGDGGWKLTQCPMTYIDNNTGKLIEYANHADNGHLPVAGGMLDQTPAFVSGLAMIRAERAAYGGID
jgi:hypothetical protein